MSIEPASTIEEAYRIFEPRPLPEDSLAAFYATRSDTVIDRLARKIALSDRHSATKWLVTGHRGNGKSTEFQRLRQKLRETHIVVYIDVDDKDNGEGLELSDIQTEDILIFVVLNIYRVAYREGLILDKDPAVEGLFELIKIFRGERTPTEGKISAKLNTIFAEIAVEFNKELDFRRGLRDHVISNYPQLLVLSNSLLDSIVANAAPKALLVIVDSMDRLAPGRALDAFHTTSLLRALKCHAIYTPPLSIFYHPDFAHIRLAFENNDVVLPNVSVKTHRGDDLAEGRAFLREIILKRLRPEVIEDAALEQLITLSGGLPRELVALAHEACSFALDESARIELTHIERAAITYRNQFARMLTADDYTVLCAMYGGRKRPAPGPELQMVLHKLAVLEYEDAAGIWYDAHPVVSPLLEERCHDHAA